MSTGARQRCWSMPTRESYPENRHQIPEKGSSCRGAMGLPPVRLSASRLDLLRAFDIREAFRPPRLNRDDGGASRSRHIYGEAVDLVIGDINRDGTANAADKAIVLELLEHKFVRNKGGIGRYPGSQTVHFDFRGKRARWDSY